MPAANIELSHDPLQDRLLLTIPASGRTLRCWLTRRMVQRAWPILIKLLEHRPEVLIQANAESRKALIAMNHDKALGRVQVARSAKPAPSFSPSETFLVKSLRAGSRPDGAVAFDLGTAEGSSIQLTFSEPLFHGFIKTLQQATERAAWKLELALPDGPGKCVPSTPPRRVH